MEFAPSGRSGNFFNTQDRRTQSVQWTESLTHLFQGPTGEHLLNVGLDVMRASYTGTSLSRSVIVRRADGTVSQRFDFGGQTAQQVGGTDIAFYAQDRWRPGDRLLVEPGIRVDRDGVLQRTTISPRIGAVVRLLPGDASVVRGGVGVFCERTPLNVGAFESFEPATVTRFDVDGVTALSPPVTLVHRASALEMPRGLVWNLEYDHRVGSNLFFRVNHLQRRGSREAIVEPVPSQNGGELRLDSRGRSRYIETEVTMRYGVTEERRLTISYVRSHSTADSNAFDAFYGNIRNPLVRPNEYSLTSVDVPNRVLVSGVLPFRQKWTVSSMLEIRNGFPYSVTNEDQEFVGARNTGGRFPIFCTLDARILRTVTLKGRKLRVGLRVNHLINSFLPRDVQGNEDAPDFRRFYNGIPRLIAFTMQWIG